jgi:hypothetical protein
MAAPKGNKNAAKAKEWEAAITHALTAYESSSVQRGLALRAIAKKLIDKALDGELAAMQEIGNRLDGKPKESVEHSGSFEHRHSTEMSEVELERIAAGGSAGDSEATQSPQEPSPVH